MVEQLLSTPEGRKEHWENLRKECEDYSIVGLLQESLKLPGDVIECGVFRGRSLQRLCRTIGEYAPEKRIYACDSYEGFPEDEVTRQDTSWFRPLSKLRRKFKVATDTPEHLRNFFSSYDLKGEVIKGYFSDTLGRFEDTQFCFIHLDVDIYSSYKYCLETLYKNLVPGGTIVFDEYQEAKWPGADKAIDEFFEGTGLSPLRATDRTHPAWYIRKPEED